MKTPFSVQMIVALEWLLGGGVGLSSLTFLVTGLVVLRRGGSDLGFFVGASIVMAAISLAIFYVAAKLRRGLRSAWIASLLIGICASLFGFDSFYDGRYGTGPDSEFGLLVGPLAILFALVGIVFLVLPQTRRYCDPIVQLADSAEPPI